MRNKCTIKYFEKIVHAYDFTFERAKKDTFFGFHSWYKIGDSCFISKNDIITGTADMFVLNFFKGWYDVGVNVYE